MKGFRLIPDDTSFNFMAVHKLAFVLSLLFVAGSILQAAPFLRSASKKCRIWVVCAHR